MEQGAPTQMAVSDSGGEISASIEETNKMRASLGLPPLSEGKTTSKEEQARAHGRELMEAQQKDRDEEALREKLDASRRQRMLHQKVGGKGLGEQLAGEEMDSAAAWVSKSRRQEDDRKTRRAAKPKKKASALERSAERYDQMDEMEQDPSQVAGALIGHSTDDFVAGESAILTLADKAIVTSDGHTYALDEEDEMLENVNMAEDWRRNHQKEMARGPAVDLEARSLLNKYDEEKERATVRLDAAGGVDEAKLKKLAAIKARLAQKSSGGAATHHDLGGTAALPTIAPGTDYLAAEEMVSFKKASAGKPKKLRRKKKDAGEKLDLDELAAGAGAGADHGSRAARAERLAAREAEVAEARAGRTQRFERALASAESEAERVLRPTEPQAQEDAQMAEAAEDAACGVEEPAAEEEAEVDSELYAALARARRLGAMSTERRNEDFAAQRLKEQLGAAERWAQESKLEAIEGGTELGNLEFSETGEFCKAVRNKEEGEGVELPSHMYKQFKAEQERQLGGAESTMPVKRELGEEGEDEPKVKREEADDDDDDDDDDGGDQASFLYERAAGSGMGAALEMARSRGMIGEEKESAGRMFDQKGAGLHAYDEGGAGEPSFKLQYYDEFGRKMTQKQAFRQLSWKFHGKKPSKKRQEKRMAEVEKQQSELGKDRAMEYMSALQTAQQSTKSAHVVLTGAHAIKSADVAKRSAPTGQKQGGKTKKAKGAAGPSSGFATGVHSVVGLGPSLGPQL